MEGVLDQVTLQLAPDTGLSLAKTGRVTQLSSARSARLGDPELSKWKFLLLLFFYFVLCFDGLGVFYWLFWGFFLNRGHFKPLILECFFYAAKLI